jgi:hypothetical protein
VLRLEILLGFDLREKAAGLDLALVFLLVSPASEERSQDRSSAVEKAPVKNFLSSIRILVYCR